jgi:prepilin-type N-terminal cleavage/methylation domain-containing protein
MRNLMKQQAEIWARLGDSGFTMVEILVALVAAAVIVSAALQLYITQHNQFLVQEDVSEIQANARAAAEKLAEEIRKTGYRLPGIVTMMEAANSNPDTLVIKYATAKLGNVYLVDDMSALYDNLRCTGNPINRLEAGDWVYVYDPEADTGEAFVALQIDYESNTIYHDYGALLRAYPAGSQVFSIARDKFYIDRSDNQGHPNLMVERLGESPQILAENIETLDFEYYLDDGSSSIQLTDPNRVRMIGINVVARSFRPELNSPNGEYRTRDFTLKVKLRNFGLI